MAPRRRRARFSIAALLSLVLFAGVAAAQHPTPLDRLDPATGQPDFLSTWRSLALSGFDVRFPPDDPAAEREARYHAATARRAIDLVAEAFPGVVDGQIALEVHVDPREFARSTGIAEPQTPAAARGSPPTIYVNAGPMRAFGIAEQERVYAHEYSHVFIGRHVRARLPLWLDEGIAQLVAGETPDELALALGRLTGRLPRLTAMTSRFPELGSQRSLAYAMSRSVVGHIVRERHPIEGARGLIRALCDPVHGPGLVDFYQTGVVMDNIQATWEANLGFWKLLLRVLSDETTQWILFALFTVVVYAVAKWKRRRRLAAMEEPAPAGRPSSFELWEGPIWRPDAPESPGQPAAVEHAAPEAPRGGGTSATTVG